MGKCFVIQPFDNAKYDSRYKDMFAPAILKAGLEPYRVDKDLSVRVPIDQIEKEIIESDICFADITSDNPNVWYELGFAFACKKDVVMVCSDERTGNFPFDIQHRYIIKYKTSSKSDFEALETAITGKILALLQSSVHVEKLKSAPIADTEGLKSHEITVLILIMQNQLIQEDSMFVHNLKNEMGKAGFTDIATSVAINTLKLKDMLETFMYSDWNNNEVPSCRLTGKGINWILQNQDQLEFRKPEVKDSVAKEFDPDDLPF